MKMLSIVRVLTAQSALLLVLGCGDVTRPSDSLLQLTASASPQDEEDPGLRMRGALRSLADSTVIRSVSDANRIVLVGIREPNATRGVDHRGRSLPSPGAVGLRRATLRSLGARIVYEFEHIPVIAVELPTATLATTLRHLPWVDYLQPNVRDISHDQSDDGQSTCVVPITATQTVPWQVTRTGAQTTWGTTTGRNGTLLILDDGVNLTQGPTSATTEINWSHAFVFNGQ